MTGFPSLSSRSVRGYSFFILRHNKSRVSTA
uniref:Uncharacterized protein n=1 Tax=virus sp. ctQ5V6 TaxID=2825815 RepID=A0A8S5RQI4_9VIRU|nr:MAG TPA: hypothetical protein [virus sp. ctQ5V6]